MLEINNVNSTKIIQIGPTGPRGVQGATIEFGNKNNQRTPGILLYYPVGTNIKIYYKKFFDETVYEANVVLDKTYANVSNLLDGPLQSGYKEHITAIFKKSIVFSNKNIAFLNISVKTIKHQPSL